MTAFFAAAITEAERQGDRYWFPVRLIRFYMLLPDPLPLPDRYTYIRTSPLTPWDAEAMEQGGFAIEVPGRGWIDKLQAQTVWAPTVGSRSVADGMETNQLKQLPRPLGLHKLISVVRMWNGDMPDSVHFTEFEAVHDVRVRHRDLILKARSNDGISPPCPSFATIRDYSVAEVVVPLFRHDEVSENDAWNYSLSLAHDAVRHMQRALNMTRPLPLQLLTRERLPFIIIFETGTVSAARSDSEDFPVEEWTEDTAEANISDVFQKRPAALTRDELEIFDHNLMARLTAGPMYEYLELRRKAIAAVEREGNYDESIIWSATTAEYMLDEALRLMMWDTGKRPEKCVEPFRVQSIAKRVESNFSSITGPDWNLRVKGPFVSGRKKWQQFVMLSCMTATRPPASKRATP